MADSLLQSADQIDRRDLWERVQMQCIMMKIEYVLYLVRRMYGVILIVRKIFYHLEFYIDTPENAAVNGLESSSPSLNAQERLVLHSLIWAFS